MLQSIDSGYRLDPKKPCQAVDNTGYEVELLAVPSRAPLARNEVFEPMVSLLEPKDARQGQVVLGACRHFLTDTYPLDIDFVLDLPEELRDLFNDWAQEAEYEPPNT